MLIGMNNAERVMGLVDMKVQFSKTSVVQQYAFIILTNSAHILSLSIGRPGRNRAK